MLRSILVVSWLGWSLQTVSSQTNTQAVTTATPAPTTSAVNGIRVDCSPPEPPVNGFAAEGGQGPGTVQFGCNDGYTLNGSANATCDTSFGVWDSPPPLCEQTLNCSPTQPPVNGIVLERRGTPGFVEFFCDGGYVLNGTGTAVCDPLLGDWIPPHPPVCEQATDCPLPEAPVNGFTRGLGSGEVGFGCVGGYIRNGPERAICDAELGVWDSPPPTCELFPYCSPPEPPLNGYTEEGGVDGVVLFTCYGGYILKGLSWTECDREQGVWDSPPPRCELASWISADCSPPEPPVNGFVAEGGQGPGTVQFGCNDGYSLHGSASATCNASLGVWDAPPPFYCSPPQPPVNGLVLEIRRPTGFVEFVCDGGFVLNGTGTAFCDPLLGDWNPPNPPVCEQATDCPPPEAPRNGFTEEHAGEVLFRCFGGYNLNGSHGAICDAGQGVWDSPRPTCEPSSYCSPPEPPLNGYTKEGGVDGVVLFTCYGGYILKGLSWTECDREQGVWDSPPPRCELASWIRVDCSPPEPPVNGFAVEGCQGPGTVIFGCNDGFSLHGSASTTCDASLGVWDAPPPFCNQTLKVPTIEPCPSGFDEFGIFWHGTPPGTQAVVDCIHLEDGLEGVISRSCSSEGDWRTPLYYCIRDTLATVLEEIEQLLENPTRSSVEVALSKLANATSATDSPFEGEIKPIVELLETITYYIEGTPSVKETEDFFSIADDLLGRVNEPAWERLIETSGDQEGGFELLRLIEQFAENLVDDLADGESRTLTGDNVYLQLVKLHSDSGDNDNILFPSENGLATSNSYIYLSKTSLVGSTAYIAATYKHLTGILPETYQGSHTGDLDLNSVVLSLTLLPTSHTALQDPVLLTYEHLESDKSDPTCSFWDYYRNSWSSDGCELVSTSEKISTCECDHLTNFALLMSPLAKPVDTLAISIITYVGCCLSCLLLIVTIGSHVFLWRYVKADRVVILINLSTALVISYVVFLAGIRQTTHKDACKAVAVILQYIYLVVFFLMLAESIEIAVTVLHVFPTRSRLPWMIPLAWGIPVVIVAISAGAVKLEGYGNEVFCWLSTETSLIWAFAGPALVIILINFVILILVMRAMFQTEAIKKSSTKAKAKTGIRCLCVLVPLMGLSWVLGIFYVSERHAWVQYVFAVCNSLQGVVIFLFHCLFNEKIRSALRSRRRRLSDSVPKSSSDSKLGKRLTMLDCVTICNPHKTYASTTAETAGSASQTVTSKSKTAGDASLADDTPSLSAPRSGPATSNVYSTIPETISTVPGDATTVPGDSSTQPALFKQTTESPKIQDADQPRLQDAPSVIVTTNTTSNAKPTTESTRVNSQEPSLRMPAQEIATQTDELQSDVFNAQTPAVATYVYQSQPKSQSLREASQPLMSRSAAAKSSSHAPVSRWSTPPELPLSPRALATSSNIVPAVPPSQLSTLTELPLSPRALATSSNIVPAVPHPQLSTLTELPLSPGALVTSSNMAQEPVPQWSTPTDLPLPPYPLATSSNMAREPVPQWSTPTDLPLPPGSRATSTIMAPPVPSGNPEAPAQLSSGTNPVEQPKFVTTMNVNVTRGDVYEFRIQVPPSESSNA